MSELFKEVSDALDVEALTAICEMREDLVASAYDLTTRGSSFDQSKDRWTKDETTHFFRDNGSNILFVAHLDTVVSPWERKAGVAETCDGLVIHSGALDDRLGAYVGLELLPRLGINHDVLLTVGEESGRSTAKHFRTEKEYNWIIEFDRGGTDVVMYEYDDSVTRNLVQRSGAHVGLGSFTDICYLTHLEVKGFNWGVGYDGDYHTVRGFAYLDDTVGMVVKYLKFYDQNSETYLPHEDDGWSKRWGLGGNHWSGYHGAFYDRDDCLQEGDHQIESDHEIETCPLYADYYDPDTTDPEWTEYQAWLELHEQPIQRPAIELPAPKHVDAVLNDDAKGLLGS